MPSDAGSVRPGKVGVGRQLRAVVADYEFEPPPGQVLPELPLRPFTPIPEAQRRNPTIEEARLRYAHSDRLRELPRGSVHLPPIPSEI